MKYFYIHPFKPQYFFPKSFKKHKVFLSFFEPYSLKGSISWFLFRNCWLYRICFGKSNIESFIPEDEIRKVIGLEPLMAFNTGTLGPERKITGLGLEKNSYFFMKYANTPLAIKNVTNEYNTLNQLSKFDFVPKIQNFYVGKKFVMLKTGVLTGKRLGNVPLKESIFNCLLLLAQQKISSENKSDTTLKTVFAHGDFCPWNMMEKNERILLFDWEMGGNYLLGYDLFSFIFQTNFLLAPKKPIVLILEENREKIDNYFEYFKISKWKNYLIAFCRIKVGFEKKKGKKGMLSQYETLLNHAEKS